MHVVFISACEKRAKNRTRCVLDSYALRSGDTTWMTPITEQGLQEVRMLLRRSATRQTAVACFRNDGRSRMRLMWVVGNKHSFNRNRASPVAKRQKKFSEPLPDWKKECALLASAGGLMHDLGKFNRDFQKKLSSFHPVADPVRHEWISLYLVRNLLDGKELSQVWKQLEDHRPRNTLWSDTQCFNSKLGDARSVLLYLIATHHKLPSIKANHIQNRKHVRDPEYVPAPVCMPSETILAQIARMLRKIEELPNRSSLYWRAAATLSRMALILADHCVSASDYGSLAMQRSLPPATAYANTNRKTGALDQPLDWHLDQVGQQAGSMVVKMLSLQPPSLPAHIIDRICAPLSSSSRFFWQEKAYRALKKSRKFGGHPHLILNLAGTGSGKTWMNARAACAMADGEDPKVRFATALNLRTLTLQSGDAYSSQLGIPADEMSCIIGDRLTSELHAHQKSLLRNRTTAEVLDNEIIVDDDENPPEQNFEVPDRFRFEYLEAPNWLSHFLRSRPGMDAVIGAPVLVSTIDFLIAAGEPHRQANHALAALRLMTSELILDEIDSFDPKALIAVLRLVMMSALFGRSVIASSATLAEPVARLLWQAFHKGTILRSELAGDACVFKTAFIDNAVDACIRQIDSGDSFSEQYRHHVDTLLSSLRGQCFRVPVLLPVPHKEEASWMAAILSGVLQLHEAHALKVPDRNAKISFGLVRIANIGTAVKVAAFLANKLPQARVVCYHSQHFSIQRFHIEQRLDELLSRAKGDNHFWKDAEIIKAIGINENSGFLETPFIVVATPVEEIGRDHDFDWAVIEPSSVQSIVQTAGRVNRHRFVSVSQPNIALLQFNFRAIRGLTPVFTRPGLEAGISHPSHDMAELLDWAGGIEQIDARLRFDSRHKFTAFDNDGLTIQTELSFDKAIGLDSHHWMGQETYTETPLREKDDCQIELTMPDAFQRCLYEVREENSESSSVSRILRHIDEPVPNTWLVMSDTELEQLAKTANVSRDRAMTVSAKGPFLKNQLNDQKIARHMSFGFYPI